jgi:hypothetical protein
MARIRNVKPDFFLHEGLAELSPLHRLFFIGLWTLADKDGRLEDRPKRIKAAVLPWEKCEVEQLLTDLHTAGFIIRYEAGGHACIAIPAFTKHQRPHPKETSLNLPPPPEPGKNTASREISRQAAPNPPAIPSSPAGNGEWRVGMENGHPESRVVPPSATPVPSAASELAGTTLLMERLAAAYREVKGGRLKTGASEDLLLRELLEDKADGDEAEVERRWGNALRWPIDYPAFAGLPGLRRHWDTYAELPPSSRGTGPPARAQDIRRGVGRVDDDFGPPGVSHAGK